MLISLVPKGWFAPRELFLALHGVIFFEVLLVVLRVTSFFQDAWRCYSSLRPTWSSKWVRNQRNPRCTSWRLGLRGWGHIKNVCWWHLSDTWGVYELGIYNIRNIRLFWHVWVMYVYDDHRGMMPKTWHDSMVILLQMFLQDHWVFFIWGAKFCCFSSVPIHHPKRSYIKHPESAWSEIRTFIVYIETSCQIWVSKFTSHEWWPQLESLTVNLCVIIHRNVEDPAFSWKIEISTAMLEYYRVWLTHDRCLFMISWGRFV